MEIMSKVICPYCKEWLDIESFLTMDDLKTNVLTKSVTCVINISHFI